MNGIKSELWATRNKLKAVQAEQIQKKKRKTTNSFVNEIKIPACITASTTVQTQLSTGPKKVNTVGLKPSVAIAKSAGHNLPRTLSALDGVRVLLPSTICEKINKMWFTQKRWTNKSNQFNQFNQSNRIHVYVYVYVNLIVCVIFV